MMTLLVRECDSVVMYCFSFVDIIPKGIHANSFMIAILRRIHTFLSFEFGFLGAVNCGWKSQPKIYVEETAKKDTVRIVGTF